ncbi:hypothetical protein ACFVYE_09705 [Streptomyces sp. NPDC058239]|uniref:hypothetical protein n=1 Tax=Streptomyces sp. NPDC058239 TaxID=3346395 RepID=UPI0036EABCDA
MRKLISRGIAIGAGGVAMVIFASTAAYAGTDVNATAYGAYGQFISNGDKFYVKDMLADGYAVRICYRVNNGSVHTLTNPAGYGTTGMWDLDLAEGSIVTIDVARTPDTCSPWAVGYA